MQDIGLKTQKSLIWNTTSKILYQVFRFAISIIVARILEPRDFGIMGIASMIAFYVNSFTNFGFNRALIQRKEINNDHINSVFTIDLAISTFLMIIVIVTSSIVARFFNMPELNSALVVLSFIFMLTSFYHMPITLFKRRLEFKTVALIELYRGIIQSLSTLGLALLGYGYWSLILGLMVSQLYGVIAVMNKSQWRPHIAFNASAIKEIFGFGSWNFIRSQIMNVNEYADKFVIGKFLGPVLLGFYEKAFSTVALQRNSLTLHIDSVMFSSFSRIQGEAKIKIKNYLKKSICITSLLVFPVNVGLITLGTPFVMILLGDKWRPMILPMKILAIAFLLSGLNGLLASLNIGVGNHVKQITSEGICNVVLIILCLISVQYGLEFVAISVFVNYLMIFAYSIYLARDASSIGIYEIIESISPAMIGSLVMAGIIVPAKKLWFGDVTVGNFILLSLLGSTSYLMAITIPRYACMVEYRELAFNRIRKMFDRRTC